MLLMGILNTTPDSFSDGGLFLSHEDAVRRGKEMMSELVDIIDVGGESTRPGAERISDDEELARTIPVISTLAQQGAVISIDTMRANTARKAVEAGARYINDVSGGKADPEMFDTAAEMGVPYIVMHWRGHSTVMDSLAQYSNVVDDVIAEIMEQVEKGIAAGISKEKIVIDPGLGFAKNAEQNWDIVEKIGSFVATGFPVLVGGSRKRFLRGDKPLDRESASIELTRRLSQSGVWGVRVHTVAPHKAVLR